MARVRALAPSCSGRRRTLRVVEGKRQRAGEGSIERWRRVWRGFMFCVTFGGEYEALGLHRHRVQHLRQGHATARRIRGRGTAKTPAEGANMEAWGPWRGQEGRTTEGKNHRRQYAQDATKHANAAAMGTAQRERHTDTDGGDDEEGRKRGDACCAGIGSCYIIQWSVSNLGG